MAQKDPGIKLVQNITGVIYVKFIKGIKGEMKKGKEREGRRVGRGWERMGEGGESDGERGEKEE